MAITKIVNPGETFKTFYKDIQLRNGQDILFTFWNESGSPLFLEKPADVEIPDAGVYYVEHTAPAIETYILIMGIEANQENPIGFVVKVGDPVFERAYFFTNDLSNNVRRVDYEIYDHTGADLKAGTMDNVVDGLWFSTSTKDLPKPWVIEIEESFTQRSELM